MDEKNGIVSGCGCSMASDEEVDSMLDGIFGPDELNPPGDDPSENLPPPPSILQDVKKWVGITREYDVFDSDILMSINAAFFTLHQLGVGPKEGFAIEDGTEDWPAFSEDKLIVSGVKQYVQLKVRNTFDPPTSSYVLNANQSKIEELEWRLRELAEGVFEDEEPPVEEEPPIPETPVEPGECDCPDVATNEEVHDILVNIFGG